MAFDPTSATEDDGAQFDPSSAVEFDPGSAVEDRQSRRGGTAAELRKAAGTEPLSASRPLPEGVKPSQAGGGRGFVNPMPAAVQRADAPLANRQEAIDDAVDRIEMGAPAEQVFGAFGKMGVTQDEIIARGKQLGGKAFAGGPGDLTPATAAPADPVGTVTAVEPTTMEGVANFGRRVKERGGQAATGALVAAGVIPNESAAASLASSQKRMDSAAVGSEIQKGLDAFGQVKTYGEAFQAVIDHPAALFVTVAESAALSVSVMAVAALAGLPGLGTAAVAGGTSAALEFGSVLTSELSDKGIDARDVVAVGKALDDPAFMSEVRKKGAIRGLTIGMIDGLTAGMAGRFIKPVMEAVEAGKITARQAGLHAAAAATKELATQVAGGAGGEKLAQMLTGEDKPFDVVLEGIAEGFTFPGEAASNIRGARKTAGNSTPEAQFARALEDDVRNTYFKAQPVADYARTALSPSAYDPNVIDPRIQAQQLAAERAQMPASPAAPAGQPAGSAGVTPGGPQAAGAFAAAPTVEEQPDTPLTAEQVAALAAEGARAKAAAQGVSSDVAAAEPRGDAAVGIAKAAPGALVAASEQVLRANAQAAAADNGRPDGGTATAPGRVAAPGGAGGLGDAVGSVAGAGRDPGQPGRAGGDAAPAVPGNGAPAPARAGTAAQGALNATNQTARVPERATGGNGRVAGSDADIRREYSARYERSRVVAATTAKDLRAQAKGLRQAGTPELIREADRLDQQAANWEVHADDQPVLSMPPKAQMASFSRLQGAIGDTFGRRVVAYFDARENAADGFAENGVAFVNLAKPERSVAFTAFHELQHLIRKEAEADDARAANVDGAGAEDTKAQAATKLLDQVWGMIDTNAKRQYAERYLFRNAIEAGSMTPEQALQDPKLRDEMLSDFMGKRATDEGFMRKLAEKNPSQFRSFAERWISAIGRLLDALKGKRRQGDDLDVGGLKDLDRAIVNLERAKLVAEKVLKAWADAKPQQAEPSLAAQISRREASAREGGAGNDTPRNGDGAGVIAEVAPNPDKPEAKAWRELDAGQREFVTKEVMDSIWPQLMREIGWPKATYTFGSGTFEGEVNPNVMVSMPGASFAEIAEMAHLLGYVLDQKAMVVFDESDTAGGSQAGFVKVIPPAGMSTEQVESLRKAIAQAVPQATGDTVRDGAIVYGNFSEYGPNPLSDEQFHEAIRAAVDPMPERIEVLLPVRYRSEYIEPASRDAYLEGTRYGGSGQEPQAGRNGVRRRGGSDPGRIKALAERAVKRRDDRVSYARAGGTAGSGSLRPVKPEGLRDRPRLTFGEPRADALEVDAWHYSQAPRSSLSTAAFGTGLRGSHVDKFKASADPRLRQRAYFYANKGKGIHPEAGVGGYTHRVLLRNIYDQDSDPLKLLRGMDREAFEAGVLDAGFDGYLYRDHNLSAAVVVLGQKAIPVELAGQYGAIDAGMVVPPATKRSNSLREDNELGAFNPFANDKDIETVDMDQALGGFDLSMPSGAIAYIADRKGMTPEQVEANWGYENRFDYVALAKFLQAGDTTPGEAASEPALDPSRPLTQAEIDELNAELQAEQQWAEVERPVYDYAGPSDEKLASYGIMAEDAYDPLPYRRDGSTTIRFTNVGQQYEFRLYNRNGEASGMANSDMPGPGPALGLRNVSPAAAEAYNRRTATSIDLTRRNFDLYTAVPSAARTRVQKTWQDISNLKGAFEFKKGDPMALKGKPPVDTFNAIADELLAGSRFKMTATKGARSGWYDIEIMTTDANGNQSPSKAEIEYSGGADPRLTMHTIGLDRGSGAGKAFYQVAFAWGHVMGIKTNADRAGLTSVNTYRRTEQMMSAAARAGEAGAVNPGTGQRIYGWNTRPKDAAQKARNLVRLALASARNAAEMVPGVRDLAYDLAADTFSWRRGPEKGANADAFVATALKDKDVRVLSVSRSTLARAAVTFSAIDGQLKLDPDMTVKSPILYSSRGDSGEYADVGDPLSGDYKQLDGRTVSFDLVIQDSGQQATFTIDAARAMRNLDDRLESARQLAKCIG